MSIRHDPVREAQRGIAALAAAFLVIGIGVVGVRLDRSTAVDIDAEVERFRAEAGLEISATEAAGGDIEDGDAGTDPVEDDPPPPPRPANPVDQQRPAPTAAGGGPEPETSAASPGSSAAEPTGPGLSRRPEAGVYTYRTEGHHEIEVLRSRRRHDYPTTTSLTLRHTGCGLESRWDVLDERWESVASCVQDRASALRRITVYHEFFGRGERRTYDCDDTTVLYPASERVGGRWSGRCASDDTVIDIGGAVIDRTEVTVDGRAVPAMHVRFTNTFSGGLEGRQQIDRWLEIGSGLELRATGELDVEGGSGLDRFQLTERYERILTSREPRR